MENGKDSTTKQPLGPYRHIFIQWKKSLFLITAISALLALFFSLPWFITPKYESTLIMLPASTASLSEALLSSNIWSEKDILEFGERRHADQLIQVLESNQIRDQIIETFNLWEHYSIDKSEPFAATRLKKAYDRNIHFRRTEFQAVEVSVLDKDPVMAAAMATKMAALLDSSIHRMQDVRARKGVAIAEDAFHKQASYIQSLEDSLRKIMDQGVHDYESQAQVLYEQLSLQLARQDSRAVRQIEEKLDKLAILGGPYVAIVEELKLEKERLSILKAKVEKARMDADQDLPQKFIVSDAYVAERKSYPKQWAIIVGAALSTFLFSFILIIFYPRATRLHLLISQQVKQGQTLVAGR